MALYLNSDVRVSAACHTKGSDRSMNISRVLGAGIVASLVMGMVEMIYEAVGAA